MAHVLNGQVYANDLIATGGTVGKRLLQNNFDPACARPWEDQQGRTWIAQASGNFDDNGQMVYNSVPVFNADATLRKDEWIQLDQVVQKEAKQRLKIVGDMRGSGLVYSLPNGMGHTILQHQNVSDISDATISMDGIRRSESDRVIYDLSSLPLPIVHKDFSIPAREVQVSRNTGAPLDTTGVQLATERVAETVEKLTLGTLSSYTYGGGTVYGFTNFPNRLTKTITDPSGGGWTPEDTRNEVVAMMQQSVDAYNYGPWRLYYSTAFMQYMMRRYSAEEARSLQSMLVDLQGITSVDQADYLTGTQLLLVQQNVGTARMVIGMDVVVLQWASGDGMELHFKVMTILVPQVRADINNNTGIVHGSIETLAGTGPVLDNAGRWGTPPQRPFLF